MTLEERVEALENAIASMTAQHLTDDGMRESVRKASSETISSACRPSEVLNAAQKQAAIDSSVNAIISNAIQNDSDIQRYEGRIHG